MGPFSEIVGVIFGVVDSSTSYGLASKPPIYFDDFDDIGRRIANRFDEVFPPAAHVRQDYSLRYGGRTIENPTDIGDCVCRDVS